MSARELGYPDYDVEACEGGNVLLRFWAPGSKFGAVHVVLTRDEADLLLQQLSAAIERSYEAAERAAAVPTLSGRALLSEADGLKSLPTEFTAGCPECTKELDGDGDCFECGTGKYARDCKCGAGDWACPWHRRNEHCRGSHA